MHTYIFLLQPESSEGTNTISINIQLTGIFRFFVIFNESNSNKKKSHDKYMTIIKT